MWKKIRGYVLAFADDVLMIGGMTCLVLAARELSRAAALAAAGVSLLALAVLFARSQRR